MGSRGPVGMPENVRQLRGKTSHATPAVPAVKAPPGRPTAPSTLSREAKAEWNRVVPDLDRLGVLAKIDRASLAMYCSAWAKFVEAEKALDASGITVKDRDGAQRKSPAWQIYREAATLVATLAKELYLTPVARLRVTKPEAGDGDQTEMGIID